jgi:hypothetical protein
MLFDTGTLGWYFTYGMSADGKYAYLIIIFRVPSIGSNQIGSYDELTNSTIFNLGGYVLANGKKYPFSKLKTPIICSCNYLNDKKGNISIQLANTDTNNPNIYLKSFQFNGLNFLNNLQISFEINKQQFHVNTLASTPGRKQLASNGYGGISGVGTSYVSYPYLTGTMSLGKNEPFPIVGWLDHQWATFQESLDSGFLRWLNNIKKFFNKPVHLNWVWMTVQTPLVQYNIYYTGKRSDIVLNSRVKISGITKMTSELTDTYDQTYKITGHMTILGMFKDDTGNVTIFPGIIKLEFSDGNTYILHNIGDGRMTLLDGSENMEVPAFLHDKNDNRISGQGFIEVNKMHDPDSDINYSAQMAGISLSDYSKFYKKKLTFGQSFTALLILLLLIALFILIIWIIFLLVRKKYPIL